MGKGVRTDAFKDPTHRHRGPWAANCPPCGCPSLSPAPRPLTLKGGRSCEAGLARSFPLTPVTKQERPGDQKAAPKPRVRVSAPLQPDFTGNTVPLPPDDPRWSGGPALHLERRSKCAKVKPAAVLHTQVCSGVQTDGCSEELQHPPNYTMRRELTHMLVSSPEPGASTGVF